MTPDVLTGDEVARLLRVSRDTVYRLAARGQLPGRKVGRIWRFSKDAIHDYLCEPENHEAKTREDDSQ